MAQKAQDIEVTIPVQTSQETRCNLDPVCSFANHFWGRQLAGVAIDKALQIVYILEFKRSTDRDEGFLEDKDAEATVASREIETTVFDPASQFLSNISRRA